MISQKYLRQILRYNSRTGIFVWRKKISKKNVVGSIAGGINADGYVVIGIHGTSHYAHRLAWIYMTGQVPRLVDHWDMNPGNNKWTNLRVASKSQNSANSGVGASNRSGYKGVSWHAGARKWQAHIRAGGRSVYLGLFRDAKSAHLVYARAAKETFSNFARTS